jgi:hypothetical protein
MPSIFQHHIEVPQSAIDANGHVNNVSYVQWVQEAGCSSQALQRAGDGKEIACAQAEWEYVAAGSSGRPCASLRRSAAHSHWFPPTKNPDRYSRFTPKSPCRGFF